MAEFVLQSSLSTRDRDALEELVFFDPRQSLDQSGARAVDAYGVPAIVVSPSGLRVSVSRRDDVQCLFAMKVVNGDLQLAGMVMYLRTSPEEITVLHVGVVQRWTRSRRAGLEVVTALIRGVRAAGHRLRGVRRLSMVYLQGREFKVPLAAGSESRG
jgi:hypothetical protein